MGTFSQGMGDKSGLRTLVGGGCVLKAKKKRVTIKMKSLSCELGLRAQCPKSML